MAAGVWGVARSCEALPTRFGVEEWREIVLSGVLSHMGKHAMLLQTEDGGTIGEAATHFLDVLQPTRTHPSQQLFTFAWVLGQYVPDATMQELSDAIAVPARTQE